MDNVSVLIDSEKIKHPNTGLYAFCTELVSAIEAVKAEYGVETQYLIHRRSRGVLSGVKCRVANLFDKLFFVAGSQVDLYHATFQLERYMPRRKPVVLTIHDLNFLYDKKASKVAKYKKWVQRNIDSADQIVAISQFAKDDVLKHLDTKGKPFDVIYNGCNFYRGEQIDEPKYRPASEFLFSVGTVLRKKNFHVLPALLVGNDLELVVAGRLSSYADNIMDEARKWGVESRVHIVGEITEADKDWYYRNCKAFMFPSIAEGFGLPLIEAMSYGKPTFISRHTSLPEIGKEYSFYFNYDFDREQMQREFAAGLQEFEGRNVEEQVTYARSYSWERAARQYCEIYRRLAKNKNNE